MNYLFFVAVSLICTQQLLSRVERPLADHYRQYALQHDTDRPTPPEWGERTKAHERAYLNRFYRVAVQEQEKYGIPASIKLAQGLLESGHGQGFLARQIHNHFGIKCFQKGCTPDHCLNHEDDSPKDRFRKFDNAWHSYRAHSILLSTKDRYQDLFLLEPTDYRGWARGLKAAGYATDKAYDRKLISVIERLALHRADKTPA